MNVGTHQTMKNVNTCYAKRPINHNIKHCEYHKPNSSFPGNFLVLSDCKFHVYLRDELQRSCFVYIGRRSVEDLLLGGGVEWSTLGLVQPWSGGLVD